MREDKAFANWDKKNPIRLNYFGINNKEVRLNYLGTKRVRAIKWSNIQYSQITC